MSNRFTPGFNDLLGDIATSPPGAAQWLTAQIGATGFFINWLQAGQDDFFQIKIQVDHRVYPGRALSDFHLHYCLSSVPAAGAIVNLDYSYIWVPIGQPIPIIGSWTSATKVITFAGTEAANTHYLVDLFTNVPAPPNQTYSSIFFFKCTRNSSGIGADTYAGNLGLLYVDAHALMDRSGSVKETRD